MILTKIMAIMARMVLKLKKKNESIDEPVVQDVVPQVSEVEKVLTKEQKIEIPIKEQKIEVPIAEQKIEVKTEENKVEDSVVVDEQKQVVQKKNKRNRDSPKKVAARKLFLELTRNHPDLFPMDGTLPKPWKIGIRRDIKRIYESVNSVTGLACDLWQRKHMVSYCKSIIDGDSRYDLDGNPVELITEDNKEYARRILDEYTNKKKNKKRKARGKLKKFDYK